jgi:hypothetical protein
MLGQPGRDTGGRAVRQQVHDPMAREIDQDGTIPMAPPPGLLVDANRLEGWRGRDRRPPAQAEHGGRTDREPQAGRESGSRLSVESESDRPQSRDEPVGFTGVRGN